MAADSKDPRGSWELLGDIIAAVVAPFLLVLLLFTCSGCSPKVIEHTVIRRDTTYIEKVRVDSLFQKDSILIREKGDTVFIYKEHIRDRWHYVRDTVEKVRVDSVAVEREKIVEVEKPLSKWKTFETEAFPWVVGGILLLLLWTFRKFIF
jgi:hypothetical protein